MRLKKKCRNCTVAKRVAGCLFGCEEMERITRELEVMMRDSVSQESPIEEQLRRCPEAFKAGELIGKMFDSLPSSGEETANERYLPPPGSVLPPLV